MYTQLSLHAAAAHQQDLLRAAKVLRLADELPRQRRFSPLSRILASARFGSRRTTVGTAAVEISPSV